MYSCHNTKYFDWKRVERQDVLYVWPMWYKCGTTS